MHHGSRLVKKVLFTDEVSAAGLPRSEPLALLWTRSPSFDASRQ